MANPLRALPRDRFDYWAALHLANRAGFGGTPAQVRALAELGLDGAVDAIVEVERSSQGPAELAWDAAIMRPPTADERNIAREARRTNDEATLAAIQRQRQERQQRDRRQLGEMQRWWLARMIESGRPLEEKMTLFWHGHFATGYRTIEDSWHMLLQNRLFREHATGNFARLVHAVIRDPAMLEYLDNDENRRQRPNENLARELMELFVLGEGHGYRESDIKEAARTLTGFTFEDDEFRFTENAHDPGAKTILGRRGNWDGDDLVRLILGLPAASEFLCLKLYRAFVDDRPGNADPESVRFVRALAKEFRESDYELKPILRSIFRSEHFYDAGRRGSVIKSPIQLIVQAIRSYRTPTRELGALVSAADLMGQHLFQPPSVKGWDGGRAWINTATLFVRQNLLVYLLTGRKPDDFDWQVDGTRFDATHLVEALRATVPAGAPLDPREVAEFLLRFSLATPPHPERVEAVRAFWEEHALAPENDRLLGALCLITALPEYQVC